MAKPDMSGPSALEIVSLTGPALAARLAECLADVARLRIDVFRAWPYLYEGTEAYERRYLTEFAAAKDALVVIASDGGTVVGAATAAPLTGHTPEFAALFVKRGLDPEQTFYCGESVLLPSYRGRGIGHAFFDRRETHARACRGPKGPFTQIAFCGVVRSADDPRTPKGYTRLDGFWLKRGYKSVDGLVGSYNWREVGTDGETENAMQFWMKAL